MATLVASDVVVMNGVEAGVFGNNGGVRGKAGVIGDGECGGEGVEGGWAGRCRVLGSLWDVGGGKSKDVDC